MERYKEKDVLMELYNEYKNIRKIAEILEVNHKTISIWMKKHGIKTIGSQGARKNNLNHDFFESIDSEEKAYWLGFIMADGCVYKGSDESSLRLQINLKGSDVEHLEKFQNAIGSSYKVQTKMIKTSSVCILKVNSTKMCRDLIALNVVPRKSLVAEMPLIQEDLQKHYIRGYFDGDGCLDFVNKRIRARMVGTENMMSSIHEILKRNGICSSVYKPSTGKKVFSLEIAKKAEALSFSKWIYEESSTYLSRKKELYESSKGCPL